MDSDSYFLACSRYIELNPVRAWMVAKPGDYPWSSYGTNAHGPVDPLPTAHARYLAPTSHPEDRASAYRALLSEALPQTQVQQIRVHLQQQKVFGVDRFRSWVAARTGKFVVIRPIGRPPRGPHGP